MRGRDAFTAGESCGLMVADYSQLELRIMAHMTKCESMIEAFNRGVDFHSAAAYDMYPHIQNDVKAGNSVLDWDKNERGPKEEDPVWKDVPLVKHKFNGERKQAKILNFSIAYGKTVHGLAKDWNKTTKEAQLMVDNWYEARPEVRAWQAKTIDYVRETGFTKTMLGRYRYLPDILHPQPGKRKHAERAAPRRAPSRHLFVVRTAGAPVGRRSSPP